MYFDSPHAVWPITVQSVCTASSSFHPRVAFDNSIGIHSPILDTMQCIHDLMNFYIPCFTSDHEYDGHINVKVTCHARCPRSSQCVFPWIVAWWPAPCLVFKFGVCSHTFLRYPSLLRHYVGAFLFADIFFTDKWLPPWAGGTVFISMCKAVTLRVETDLEPFNNIVRMSSKTSLGPSMRAVRTSNRDKWVAHLCIPESTCLGEFERRARRLNTSLRFLRSVNTYAGCRSQK